MSAKLHYMILCDAVVFSQGKFTYYGVFDRIQAFSFPCVHQSLAIAVQLTVDPGPHKLTLRAVDSEGRDVIPKLPAVPIETNHLLGLTTTSITLQGLRLEKQAERVLARCRGRCGSVTETERLEPPILCRVEQSIEVCGRTVAGEAGC